jgi:DNA replication protein DnaC
MNKKEANKKRAKFLKKQWRKKHFNSALKLCPLKFQTNFESYNTPEIKEIKSSYIYGEVGNGKTILAAFLFLQAIEQTYYKKGYYPNVSAHFVNFPDLFFELQKTMKDFSSATVYEKYLTCDILVIDDFLKKKVSDWVADIVYHIINSRYEQQLLTILTSNLTLPEVSDKLQDDRVTRRIEESFIIAKKAHYSKSK